MKNRKWHLLLRIALLAQLFVSVFIFAGCGKSEVKVYTPIENTGGNEYALFDAEKASPRFSFEYPSDYQLTSYQPMPAYPSTSVIFYVPHAEVSNIKSVEIWGHTPYEDLPDAETSMNHTIDENRKDVIGGFSQDLKIIEKNKVIIGDIQGWELVLSSHITDKPIHGYDALPTEWSVVERYLFFDYRGMVWSIRVISATDVVDQAKADFEHIIQTFKILD